MYVYISERNFVVYSYNFKCDNNEEDFSNWQPIAESALIVNIAFAVESGAATNL